MILNLIQMSKTKLPDFDLTSPDTSIKVTGLPLTYAVHPWSEQCECTLMQK